MFVSNEASLPPNELRISRRERAAQEGTKKAMISRAKRSDCMRVFGGSRRDGVWSTSSLRTHHFLPFLCNLGEVALVRDIALSVAAGCADVRLTFGIGEEANLNNNTAIGYDSIALRVDCRCRTFRALTVSHSGIDLHHS